MPEWSFQRKLITGVILICLLAILTSGAALFASRVLIANMEQVATGEGRDLVNARALQLASLKSVADAHAGLLAGGGRYGAEVGESSFRVREMALALRAGTDELEAHALIDSVLSAEHAHQAAFARARAMTTASHPASATEAKAVIASGQRLDRALATLVTHLATARLRSLAVSRSAVNRSEALLNTITIATVLLLVVLCIFLIAALNRSYRYQRQARKVAERGQTQARAALTEAVAAGQLKDEFLATVSHELRNPLAPILMWTQLLRGGTLDAQKTKRALEVIERNVTSQAELIDDLVDVARVAGGKFRLDVRPVDLVPIIKAAVDALTPASDAKKIRMQLVLDERAGTISGDSERLLQVMSNLISNAIKFTPKNGRVQILLQRVESHLEVIVADNGSGISADFLPHVFEPFQQATGGSMRRHAGLGLGLSIARHIVELHGGEITAQSAGEALGSRFELVFPLLATAAEFGDSPRRHPIAGDPLSDLHHGRLDGVRVLVVDDEPSASEALQALFESCGAEARVAGSSPEALAVFEAWRPDVVVSDIAMPGEDGYALIRRIRQRSGSEGGDVPAVALTAYAKIEDRVTILAAGFQMYLSKPSDPNELVAVVGSLARRRTLTVIPAAPANPASA